jgi:hypothetical protein
MVSMWEVRAADGRLAELLDWVLARVQPDAQVYRSAEPEQRVVVIDPSGQAEQLLAGLPTELAARPAHAWNFEQVRND